MFPEGSEKPPALHNVHTWGDFGFYRHRRQDPENRTESRNDRPFAVAGRPAPVILPSRLIFPQYLVSTVIWARKFDGSAL